MQDSVFFYTAKFIIVSMINDQTKLQIFRVQGFSCWGDGGIPFHLFPFPADSLPPNVSDPNQRLIPSPY